LACSCLTFYFYIAAKIDIQTKTKNVFEKRAKENNIGIEFYMKVSTDLFWLMQISLPDCSLNNIQTARK